MTWLKNLFSFSDFKNISYYASTMKKQCANAGNTEKMFSYLYSLPLRGSVKLEREITDQKGVETARTWLREATPSPEHKEKLPEVYPKVSPTSSVSVRPHEIRRLDFLKHHNKSSLHLPKMLPLNKQGFLLTELAPGKECRPGNEPGKLSNSDISFAS